MYPVTDEGRGFCIFFALIGIPLFMACLAVYAQHTANFIRWVCKKLRKVFGGKDEGNEKVGRILLKFIPIRNLLKYGSVLIT